MNSIHIHTTPTWFTTKPEFSSEDLLIIYPDGEEQPVNLQILPGDPQSENEDKYKVKVWQSHAPDHKFVNVQSGRLPPVSKISYWESYLDHDAVRLITTGTGDYEHYPLTLQLEK